MTPSARSVSFLSVLVFGFVVTGVLTPVVLDPSADGESRGTAAADASDSPPRLSLPAASSAEISAAEEVSGQSLSNDLVPLEEVPSLVSSPGSRNILSLDENKHDRFFLALPNGTVYFMNRSTKPQWKLLIGQPLSNSWRSPSIDDPQYILYSDSNGELYEYIKDDVVRKHNWTIEEYVQRAPIVEGSVITTGTKTSTFFVIDADSGKLIYNDKKPFSWGTVGMHTAEEQPVASKLESGNATYITIIRTDYFLDSYDINNHLWSVMVSRISAYNAGPGLPPTMDNEMEIPSISGGNIPVYFPGEIDQSPWPKLMLPSAPYESNPRIWSGQDNEQASKCESSNNCSLQIFRNSKTDPRQILEELDNRFNSLGGSRDLPSNPKECPLGNCVAARPNFLRDANNSNELRNSLDELNKYSVDEQYAVQNNLWLSVQSIYQRYSWLLIPFLPILSVFCYIGLGKLFKYDKESNDLKERQTVLHKKRKARKAGNSRSAGPSDHDKHILSNRENAEINGHGQVQGGGTYSFINLTKPDDGTDGRWVGKLFVTNSEIGRGSNGTVVFEGVYDGRPVAVKRLLRAHHDVAFKEIQNLIASDRHANIVRWYGVEQDIDFVYISLERCICSLSDLIQICSDSSAHSISVEIPTSNSTIEHKVQLGLVKGIGKDFNLWRSNGLPSSQLLKLMRDVVSGLAHLHELGIIHRDLKPQNVLISNDRNLNAKLSDMGISKRLLEDMSALSRNATGYGSSGWQAPEQLLHRRQTRAVDLFSLGCILFFCLTKGKHPFGNHFERDANIINNRMDLFLVDDMTEAEHLLCQLLHPDPQMRLSAVEVLHHPLFWTSEMRLSFLRDASDRVELEDRENESDLLKALENSASVAFGGKWDEKLDAAFITDMGRYRKYRFDCVRDLLRVIRNKLNHYRELPKELQETLGPVPEGFDMYFTSRFPKLLIEVYKVFFRYCKEEVSLSKYFKRSHL
ncbi:serine/threonine-protein kinase/endoribonuclease IRE1a-like [Canna indica]|uniref:non-specific serine/threonine protein kinase n=1 Tax=Canna indica TaxID=4628 RepID=A0AAQ3Q1G7_9LILI|nr:serine/threonine-protein kinase/endoribonuclease IRE1a-like [Canna indica]